MMARSTIAPCKGRIQKRKTTLHLFTSGLQRTAGPYKRATYGPCNAADSSLLDHIVGADQNGIRDRHAQQLCCPGIDDEFVDYGLLDGNVAGLGTL
jgi:hypothetical protein